MLRRRSRQQSRRRSLRSNNELRIVGIVYDDDQKFVSAGYDDNDVTNKPLLDDAFREIMARIPVFGPVDRTQNESTVRAARAEATVATLVEVSLVYSFIGAI